MNLEEWRNVVGDCHEATDKIRAVMNDRFQSLSDYIKEACEENGLDVNGVEANDDNTVFTVRFNGIKSEIKFSQKFLESIGMSFSVKRELNILAENEIYIEFYPLETEEE